MVVFVVKMFAECDLELQIVAVTVCYIYVDCGIKSLKHICVMA